MKKENILKKRGAGVLMAISSLPSNYGIGTLGKAAYEFVDMLCDASQSYWQVLPIGPTSFGDSPYQSFSAFAGNPYFIDLDELIEEKLLLKEEADALEWGTDEANVDYALIFKNRFSVLKKACERSNFENESEYNDFVKNNKYWLDDYCMYMAIKFYFDNKEWQLWPEDIRFRKKGAVEKYSQLLKEEIRFWKFCQYKFYRQFMALKEYANNKKIYIIGDIPLYVAYDSADVWTHPQLFDLDKNFKPFTVAGVPPDIFSADGQRWGNPIYNWKVMEKKHFAWWFERMKNCASYYDVIRIDHFLGIVNYWAIPASAPTAVSGVWKKGPGKKLTKVISKAVGDSKIIAEDLGLITEPVKAVIESSGWPGMKILEFAFDMNNENAYLPHNFNDTNCVVYGGTHDNDTLKGYLESITDEQLDYIRKYLGIGKKSDFDKIIKEMIRIAYMSTANTAIFQIQDVLCLGNEARMNMPSTIGTNWRFRMKKDELKKEKIKELRKFSRLYNR